MKQTIDSCLSIIILFCLAPAMMLIALLIKLDDGGPIIFTQYRLGRYKRPFLIYKFRTMRENRITTVGHFLRKTGLDELPQLVNIIKGQMSLVGPRPLTYTDVTRLGWDRRYYCARWQIKPGITGLAQLYAGRSAHYSWHCDKTYLKHDCVRLDIKIMLFTLVMAILGKRRVRSWLLRHSPVSTEQGVLESAGGNCPPIPGIVTDPGEGS